MERLSMPSDSRNASGVAVDAGLAIHGGVGTLARKAMTEAVESSYRAVLTESLEAGRAVLRAGSPAVEAVVAAVRVMEDSELFNAGRGSNFDERGVICMDASIMDGATLNAGAVAGISDVRNPIELARLVMERSEHLMLIGEGAEAFARSCGLEHTDSSFFHTDRRWAELQEAKASSGARPNVLGSDAPDPLSPENPRDPEKPAEKEHAVGPIDATDPTQRSGTVGAVARDHDGRLAAATSTGGMANKTWGRVGDSPIIAAGTYASSRCAVSCTGWGEYFIRHVAAYDVQARLKYGGQTLAQATRGVIWETLDNVVPGSGGMVAIDCDGHVEFTFNTRGMYRGWVDTEGRMGVDIY
jgi:L-asparaginase / beta-aspartyl-peptidase